ncbi:ImmA/IrrE family metallo-endopeptidase [Roseobacter sp. YSTF-M11]|uniref:ImmA/IrrE family metallo-endopeptidase n=1 Tax=Roseobacter insulae TaxID=2859783 RepID=A0A9X1FRC3_9RHOB|nr:ImmA/IrrE family metallo-endopeptidase [Roseobacter insulae]MBW4706166.1 ImmA/IrrE family metallo-endopeptidase [Roseobacter insulae]
MTGSQDYRVQPMSWPSVDAVADKVREYFRHQDEPQFPILDVLEKALPQLAQAEDNFSFQVGTVTEMGSAEGFTCPRGSFIRVREDVYDEALGGGHRARFTLAHEFGHYLLHTGQNQPFERAMPGQKLRAFESAEKQADRFAGTLLMPKGLITIFDTPETVSFKFGVSKAAATVRLDKISKEASKY